MERNKQTKLSLLIDDIIEFLENSKNITDKLLKPINDFSKVAERKMNIQKSTAWLYRATNGKLNFNKYHLLNIKN